MKGIFGGNDILPWIKMSLFCEMAIFDWSVDESLPSPSTRMSGLHFLSQFVHIVWWETLVKRRNVNVQ
jgi:hypothetical protein